MREITGALAPAPQALDMIGPWINHFAISTG